MDWRLGAVGTARSLAIGMIAGLVFAGCGTTSSPATFAPTATPSVPPSPSAVPTGTLSPTIAGPPANDDPPGITITSLPFTHSTDTAQAQIHAMEPSLTCGSISQSVWYTFTPGVDMNVAADTIGSDYDTVIDVWEGTLTADHLDPGFASLKALACNDNSGGSIQSEVVFAAKAGQGYTIRVGTALNAAAGSRSLVFHLSAA